MEDIMGNQVVSQTSGEEPIIDNYNVDLDSLFIEEQVQEGVQNVEQEQEIEIDERFIGLEPNEAKFRSIQSKYDRLQADYNKFQQTYTTVEEKAKLVEELMQDPNLLYAFVNEINPNLINKPDTSNLIKQKLKEEFGESYKPQLTREQADREDPGGTDWQYYRRLDTLYTDFSKNQNKATSVKEYKEQLAKQQQAQQSQQLALVRDVQNKKNANDVETKAVIDLFTKLDLEKAFDLHRLLRRQPQTRTNLNIISGSPTTGVSPQYADFLKTLKR